MDPKSIVVTGGAGFLGQYVVEEIKRKYPLAQIHIPRSETCNLMDRVQTIAFFAKTKPTHIIHLATPSGGVTLLKERPQEAFKETFLMAMNVLEASEIQGVAKIVMAGSALSYPAQAPLPYKEHDFWNGYPDETEAPYGMAHKAAISYAKILAKLKSIKIVYLVLSNLYGPNSRFDKSAHVIPSMIQRFEDALKERKQRVELWGSGKALREFLYVEDAAKAIVKLLVLDTPEILNFGSGDEVSIKELAETVSNLMNYQGELAWDATKPEGRLRRVLDSSCANKIGLSAPTSFTEGMRKTIAWRLESVKGIRYV